MTTNDYNSTGYLDKIASRTIAKDVLFDLFSREVATNLWQRLEFYKYDTRQWAYNLSAEQRYTLLRYFGFV